jgi:hypothetical protein
MFRKTRTVYQVIQVLEGLDVGEGGIERHWPPVYHCGKGVGHEDVIPNPTTNLGNNRVVGLSSRVIVITVAVKRKSVRSAN